MTTDRYPIYHLSFKDRYTLAATFLRFQEHYESPRFHGKIFSWEEFMDWYAAKHGEFSYLADWSGFNIPHWVLEPFARGDFDPLTRKEIALLAAFERIPPPFYVIGTHGGKRSDALLHECVHGLFTVFPEYASAVRAGLRRLPVARLRRRIRAMGYAAHVVEDEINAYVLTGLDRGMYGPEVPRVRKALDAVYVSFFGASLRTAKERRRLAGAVHALPFSP